jgi:Exostosin family
MQKRNLSHYRGTSVKNSTQFSTCTDTKKDMVQNLLEPSSVGFDVTAEKWLQQFQDSKFCLVIRGDMPGSRSMCCAIKSGCIPIIVSVMLCHIGHPFFDP